MIKKIEKDLIEHLKYVKEDIRWRLPKYAYAFAIHITQDGVDIVWKVYDVNELLKQ